MLHADPSRSYSWWSDSHVNVKNSKWLHENLTDMDAKVRAMIKIIEEDADSFARRAEMYYKKRPELMKLVEEFYRAYCALAARYDHTTGELRQAHRTIADALPDQVPFTLSDDSPWGSSVMGTGPNAPEITNAVRLLFDPDNSQKHSLGAAPVSPIVKKNGVFLEENDNETGKRGLKQLNEMFPPTPAFDKNTPKSGGGVVNVKLAHGRSKRDLVFEERGEKDFELKLSGPGSHKRNELKLQGRVTQYEAPYVHRETKNKIDSELPGVDVALENQNCETTTDSEAEQLSTAELQVHDLQISPTKLQEEHEAAKICKQQDQNSFQRIADLESEVSLAHEEIRSLNEDIFVALVRFKSAEEQAISLERKCQYLQSNNDTLAKTFLLQQEELEAADNELEQLRIEMQDEHLQSMSCETTLASMTQQHVQLQEQHKLLMLELQNVMHLMKDMEKRSQVLEDEAVRLKEENKSLSAESMAFSMSIKDLHDVLRCLSEAKRKVEEEAVIGIEKRNALQHEIDCLKEERSNLDRRYSADVEQFLSIMIEKEYLQSCVKDLQDENIGLKGSCIKKDEEQTNKYQSLETMESVLEKNCLLETSLSDKRNELEVVRDKLNVLEETFHFLMEQKSVSAKEKDDMATRIDMVMQNVKRLETFNAEVKEKHLCLEKEKETFLNQLEELQDENTLLKESCNKKDEENIVMCQNLKTMESVFEKNLLLEKSLSDKSNDLEVVREKLNILEESFHSLMKEKSVLAQEKDNIATMVDNMIQTVNVLEVLHAEFKENGFCLEKEKETLLNQLEEAQAENNLLKESCKKKDEEKLVMSQSMKAMESVFEEKRLLGKLLSDKSNDLEVVREKLDILEESFRSLVEESSVLAKEKNSIATKVDNLMQIMQILEALNAETTEKRLCLEMEKETLLQQIEELQTCLELEREQYMSVIQSISEKLNNLEVRTDVLLQESEQVKSKLEEEETHVLRFQTEASVERCILLDICRMCRSLSLECQKCHENSFRANETVSQLKASSIEQQIQLESLIRRHSSKVGENIELRYGLDQLLELVNTDIDHVYPDKIGSEVIFHNLQSRLESTRALLVCTQNDNMQMFLESLITTTLLQQLGLEISGLFMKKNALEMEAVALRQEMSVLQSGKQDLEKMNELLVQKNLTLQQREQALEAEIGILCRQSYDSHESNRWLEHQNHKLHEENRSLVEDLLDLNEQKNTLEEDNISLLYEALSLGNLAVIFQSYYTEMDIVLKRLNADIDCIIVDNYNLKEQRRVMNDRLKILEIENLHFRELVEKLEEYKLSSVSLENEVDKFRSACGQLKDQIELGQELLNEKELDLSDAKQKLKIMHTETAEIRRQLECVKKESVETMEMKEAVEKDNMDLTIMNADMSKKIDRMHREQEILKLELDRLRRKFGDLKLLENKGEIELLDISCATLYCDLIVHVIHSVVLEQKVYELTGACKNLKEHIQEQVKKLFGENASMIAVIHELNRENALWKEETEKKKLESVGYLSVISSLTDSIMSLQDHCFALMTLQHSSAEIAVSNQCYYAKSVDVERKDMSGDKRNCLHELHSLHAKIDTIDMTVGGLENIKREYPEVKLIKEELENHLNILAEGIVMKRKEMKSILEEKEKLEIESDGLLIEIVQSRFQEEYLKAELKESMEEIELWQKSAEFFYHDLQSCAFRETVIKEKLKEFVGAFESLEITSASHRVEVDELKNKIMMLEGLKEEVTFRSKESLSIVSSIEESMHSLQHHCLAALRGQTSVILKASDDTHDKQNIKKIDPEFAVAGLEIMVLGLQGLLLKFKTVERLVIDLSQFIRLTNKGDRTEIFYSSSDYSEKKKIGFELHTTNSRGTQMDFARNPSLIYHRARPFRNNRIEDAEADEQMLELWETAERHCNHGAEIIMSVKASGSDRDADQIFSTNKDRDHEFSKINNEREVVIDKMEVSSETRKNKVRNMLTSEAHRLMELRNTVQGLNKRIEKLRSNSDPNGFEIDNAKEQLHRTESAILQLVDVNHQLQKNSYDNCGGEIRKLEEFKGKKVDLPDFHGPHIRKTCKRLEKVEQLESELQKIEFLLKKLEDESVRKRHADLERRARDLLREYLDGGREGAHRKKQHRFCNCIRPSTKNG